MNLTNDTFTMTEQELLRNLKYYKGEQAPPKHFGNNEMMWWGGEKVLFEKCRTPSFWDTLRQSFLDAERSNSLSGALTDSTIPENKRIIIFFLFILHGRFFPYDSLDLINSY